MGTLENCHNKLKYILGSNIEPIEVWRCAEDHRVYWRPKKVRTILLAESHVFTSAEENKRIISYPDNLNINAPRGFLRLVYCLGYGENDLVDQPIHKNPGTPHFWKIFYSCLNRIRSNKDFTPILRCTSFRDRIRNKVLILKRLNKRGVWLVDACMAALYPKDNQLPMGKCIKFCWDEYIRQVIHKAKPLKIVCIGQGVSKILHSRLKETRLPIVVIPQPNAHLSSREHLNNYQKYYNHCLPHPKH
jgi:hypothetical protein